MKKNVNRRKNEVEIDFEISNVIIVTMTIFLTQIKLWMMMMTLQFTNFDFGNICSHSDDVTKLFSSSLFRNKKFILDQMALQTCTFCPLILNALVYSLGFQRVGIFFGIIANCATTYVTYIHTISSALQPEELSVKTEGDVLVILAKHETQTETGSSFISKQFEQRFSLPSGVKPDAIGKIYTYMP